MLTTKITKFELKEGEQILVCCEDYPDGVSMVVTCQQSQGHNNLELEIVTHGVTGISVDDHRYEGPQPFASKSIIKI